MVKQKATTDTKTFKDEPKLSRHHIVLFALIFGLIGGFAIYKSFAAAPLIATMEAEQMILPAGASAITDSTASAGKAILLSSNGTTTGTVNFPSSVSSLTLIARGTQCSGAPTVNVLLDNSQIMTAIPVSTTTWSAYSVTPPNSLPAGTHNLSVTFSNDYTKSKGNPRNKCSRDLYLDVSNFYGPTPAPTPAPTVSLSATPTSLTAGQASTLTWNSTNATACTASGAWSGNQPTSGSTSTGALNQTSTYNLSCTGAGGTGIASASVSVSSIVTPPPTSSGFKVGLSTPTFPYYYYDTNTIGTEMDKIKSTFGPNIMMRIDFALSVLENPNILYARTDKIMAEANARGIKVLPVFSYSPSKWNGGYSNDKVPPQPAYYDAYASRIADAVKRYNFNRIETWNEPWLSSGDMNSGAFWLPKSDPAAFNALNTKIANAVWAVAPSASILIQADHFMQGGNNPAGATFFPQMWTAANNSYLRDSRIVFSIHTYCEGASPTETRAYGWGCDRWKVARDVAKQNGVTNPRLSVTEFGWRTPTGESNPRVVTDALGAQYTNQILTMMKADGVEDAYYFEWSQTSDSWTYNLQRADGSVKPAAAEIRKFADGVL